MATPVRPNQPRTVRMRNAVLLALAALVVGVGIGAAGTKPAAPSGTQVTEASEPPASPTAVTPSVPTPAPTVAPTQVQVEQIPLVVKGSGSQKTRPFDMPAGDFTVTIAGNTDGNVIVSLEPRSGDVFASESLFNELPKGKYKYETVVYGLAAGSYYLDLLNHGAWVVTFAALQ